MIGAVEVYFLQDLVLFSLGERVTPGKIQGEFNQVLHGRNREERIAELQREAERLGHRIQVANLLARAQA